MNNRSQSRAVALCAAAALAASCRAQFVAGEVYLLSPALPDPGGTCFEPGVLRISPGTWQTSVLAYIPGFSLGRGSFDTFRGRLVVNLGSYVELLDSAGARTALPPSGTSTAHLSAPTGDGRIYLWGSSAASIHYYDAADAVHTLMDATGASPFVTGGNIRALIYDAGTNSLFTAAQVNAMTEVVRIPLNGAGTQVAGAPSSVVFDGSPGVGENPVGFSRGPGGTLFLKIDDNVGTLNGRMRLIDPVTLQVQTFASSEYFGVAGECAGAYVPGVALAVVLDSLADQLRAFAPGEAGAGTILPATGVSSCGSGESAQFVVIDQGVCRADINGDGFVDGIDSDLFSNLFEAGDPGADYNYDGFVDGIDDDAFNNDFEAGC